MVPPAEHLGAVLFDVPAEVWNHALPHTSARAPATSGVMSARASGFGAGCLAAPPFLSEI